MYNGILHVFMSKIPCSVHAHYFETSDADTVLPTTPNPPPPPAHALRQFE